MSLPDQTISMVDSPPVIPNKKTFKITDSSRNSNYVYVPATDPRSYVKDNHLSSGGPSGFSIGTNKKLGSNGTYYYDLVGIWSVDEIISLRRATKGPFRPAKRPKTSPPKHILRKSFINVIKEKAVPLADNMFVTIEIPIP